MKLLFVLADDFPASGACTGLLKNMFLTGGMLEAVDSIDVIVCKKDFSVSKQVKFNEITIHNCVLKSEIPLSRYKQILFKHPVTVARGIAEKIAKKLKHNEINQSNVNVIEQSMRIINANAYDVIVAVMGSFEVAAAAMEYKKKNPAVKLVVYQVDPCSTNEVCPASTKAERVSFEKELYTVSDKIITTPILLKEARVVYTKEITDKMVPMEFPNVVPVKNDSSDKNAVIRCLFTGNIYGNFRDPDYTLKLFDKVDSQITFEMIGAVKPEVKNELDMHKVLYHGPKPLEETKSELAKADVLVNIGNKMLNQVPSKLFEYISYGKPIVNICKNRNCPTLPYLEKYPYVLNLFEEDELFEEQAKILNSFILENYKNRMTANEILKAFETCTPQYCAQQMLQIFNSEL